MSPPTTPSPGYPAGISAVVPVFNSAGLIAELEGELEEVLRGIGRPFEVILVNDGSSDESWQVIRRLADRHPWVRGVDLMRNYGPAQRAAVRHPRRIDGRRLERSA